ncbi:MAG: flagellar hook-basal body complex protein FliE [Bryobacteraceae bacterium]
MDALGSVGLSLLKAAPPVAALPYGIEGLSQGVGSAASAMEEPGTPGAASPFEAILSQAVERVENYRVQADGAVGRFLRGEDQEVHKVALAVQESEIAMELFLQAKNKVVQAYQEIMRMQL